MAYGAETHTNYIRYNITVEHTASGVRTNFELELYKMDSSTPTENQQDNLVQAFLNHIATLSGVAIVSAVKNGRHSASITVS